MRKLFGVLALLILVVSACSKDGHPVNGPDPVVATVFGKWVLKDVKGLETVNLDAGTGLFDDTLLYDAQMHYFILNSGDTTDRGEFSVGQDSAVNGFDRLQIYDSIVYNSASIATDAPPPPVYYYKIDKDTLLLSYGYFKDSAGTKLYARYIR